MAALVVRSRLLAADPAQVRCLRPCNSQCRMWLDLQHGLVR